MKGLERTARQAVDVATAASADVAARSAEQRAEVAKERDDRHRGLAQLVARIEALEARVRALERPPVQAVDPPRGGGQ